MYEQSFLLANTSISFQVQFVKMKQSDGFCNRTIASYYKNIWKPQLHRLAAHRPFSSVAAAHWSSPSGGHAYICLRSLVGVGCGCMGRRRGCNPYAFLWRLQVVTFHQAAGLQRAGVGEEGRLHIQASLCQCGVAAGGGPHLLGLGEVGLLPLGWRMEQMGV